MTSDDGVRVPIAGVSPNYLLHQYKVRENQHQDSIKITVDLQSTLAPTASTVYLQIYNVTTGLWETLASDNTTAANTDFELVGRITANQSDYYDRSVSDTNFPQTYDLNEITFRVYQNNI